ncbi:MAG TPA: DinB family protein [Gemmatimonadales bacterium]|nr:DinB family protein [Gemmatimonadales bacterium]
MSPARYDRPDPSEYADFYAAYIAAVPEGDLLKLLETQLEETSTLLSGLPEFRANQAYAPGKWTVKEVLGHVSDAERVFAHRALRFARGDATPLPSFDEKTWVPNSGANARTLPDLLEEQRTVREATLALLRHLPADAPTRRGMASGREISVRALAWIIAGHERHHLRILRERYLG